MDSVKYVHIPKVTWIAATPPVPPFSGATVKALFGIESLARVTEVAVITFCASGDQEDCHKRLREFWSPRGVRCRVMPLGPSPSSARAVLTGRFKRSISIDQSALRNELRALVHQQPGSLLFLDDIVLAPLVAEFGGRAILSPHDCMSRMFADHYRHSRISRERIRYGIQFLLSRLYETRVYHQALLTHVVGDLERFHLERINPQARYHVAPYVDTTGVDPRVTSGDEWDVIIWGDLRVASVAHGARECLGALCTDPSWLASHRVLLVGRVEHDHAARVVGRDPLQMVAYAPLLEDEKGRVRSAKVTVVPDLGGAGIKGRCSNLIHSGRCLACLYGQMEGIRDACDIGAINAGTVESLVRKVRRSVDDGTFELIARRGQSVVAASSSPAAVGRAWAVMVERAAVIASQLGHGSAR